METNLKISNTRHSSPMIAATALTGCASSASPSPAGPRLLVVASCPEIAPLADDSFGATTAKLLEMANQYRDCRIAALLIPNL